MVVELLHLLDALQRSLFEDQLAHRQVSVRQESFLEAGLNGWHQTLGFFEYFFVDLKFFLRWLVLHMQRNRRPLALLVWLEVEVIAHAVVVADVAVGDGMFEALRAELIVVNDEL